MNSRWITSRSAKRRLFQGVVLLFLIYTGFDITVPQYHLNESIRKNTTGALDPGTKHLESGIYLVASNSTPNQPQQERDSHRDEDCFCCCSHVVPSPVFIGPVNAVVMSPPIALPNIAIPSAPLHNPYHPPRYA